MRFTKAFIDGGLLLGANAQRFVQFAARRQDIGDPPLGDGLTPTVLHACECRQRARVGAFRIIRLAYEALQVT